MRITQVGVDPIIMPKEDKDWRFALAATSDTQGCLVQMHTDEGITGIAYATCANHYGESLSIVQSALAHFQPALIGKDPFDIAAILDELDHILAGNNFAKAGIDMALYDVMAKKLGVPLYQLLGGLVRSEIPVLRIMAIKSPAEMARIARQHVENGDRYLKIKVEGDPDEDLACVRAIREAVGPEIHLTVDANQSYQKPKDAIRSIRRLEAYNLDLVEQPIRSDDFEGLGQITRALDVPIEADESAQTLDDIFRLVSGRLVDRISIKVQKVGGLRRAQEAAAICRAGNVGCRVGATVGSRLVTAACMHFVAATPNISYACELGEFVRLTNDPAEGIEIENGILKVPTGIGVGVRLRAPVSASR